MAFFGELGAGTRLRRITSSGPGPASGDPVNQPLDREIDLRPAKAAIEAGRRLVGHDEPVEDGKMGNPVGSGQVAMVPVKSGRLGRPQIGADMVESGPNRAQDPLVG